MSRKSGLLVVTGMLTLAVGGCAGTDIELQGGLFELAGLSSIGKQQKEPSVRKRNTLVVPPSTAVLPVPGSDPSQSPQVAAAANGQAWPVDPEQLKAQQNAAVQEQHKQFCEKAQRRYEAGIDSVLAEGPLGSCDQSILRNFTGKNLFEGQADASSEREAQGSVE